MTVLQVYIQWANTLLHEINKRIEGTEDIQKGEVLCDLISILINASITEEIQGKQNVDPQTYVQVALDHFKSNGIKPYFTAQDIIDGDIKSILDCLWQLILHYNVHDINHNIFRRTVCIGKRNLLDWCQKQLNTFFDGRNTLANNLCADNWFILLLEKFTDLLSKDEDKARYISNLLRDIEVKYGINKDILIPSDIINGTVDEHALMIYISLLKRKTERRIFNTHPKQQQQQYTLSNNNKTEELSFNQSVIEEKTVPKDTKMSETTTHKEYNTDTIDGNNYTPVYRKEEEKAIILKRPTDYYNQWEKDIDRLSQGPETTAIITDSNTTPEDILLNIDDFNDSFDKSRSHTEQLYKPDVSNDDKHSDSLRSESRSPTRIIDRYHTRREYRHSPEPRSRNQTPDSGNDTSSERKSRTNVRFHGRRDDRSPSPEAFSHFDELKLARKDVDRTMPKEGSHKRSRSDERHYKNDDQVSERTKALRLRASQSLGREGRIRKQNEEMQAYNNNITDEMIKSNLGLKSDPVNVITPLRHIGSAERIYKDADSTFVKLLDVQRNPPLPYELGSSRVPRREAWEGRKSYSYEDILDAERDIGGHREFLGSLDREIDKIDNSIESLDRSRRLPRFSSIGDINDKLWSQEFRDISSIRNPYSSTYNIHDDDRHISLETFRSRSLSPRSRIPLSTYPPAYTRPRSSLGICQPNYRSNFHYEEVGLEEGKYRHEPLGRFDVRTNYYNPEYNSRTEVETSYVSQATSMSPTRQHTIDLGYSSPVRRVNDEIWGSKIPEIDSLDSNRQEKWKQLINLTDMTNEDVIELKQALASAIVENDILFAKLTNAKKEFSEKLMKTNEVLDDCRKHLATAQAENQELRTFLNQEKRINAALEARIKELEEQLNISETNYSQLEIKLEDALREIEELRGELNELEDCELENEQLKTKVTTLDRNNKSVTEDLSRMQETHERSQITIREIRKCLEEVRNERHELQDEVSRLKFKERYTPTVPEPSINRYTERIIEHDIEKPSTPIRTFKPIIETPVSSPVQSISTTYSDRQTTIPDRQTTIPDRQTTIPARQPDRQSFIPSRHTTSSDRQTTSSDRQTTSTRQRTVPTRHTGTSPIRHTSPLRPTSPIRRTSPIRHTSPIRRTSPIRQSYFSPTRLSTIPSSKLATSDSTSKFTSSKIDRDSYKSERKFTEKKFTDYPVRDTKRSTTIPMSYTSRTTSPPREYRHKTTSPIRTFSPTRSVAEGRNSRYSTFKTTHNYKPSTTTTRYTQRSTSPFKYSDVTVPSNYREIYPHRKSRYSSERSNLNSSRDYESRKSTTTSNKFKDDPDLNHYPSRLRFNDDNARQNDTPIKSTSQYTENFHDDSGDEEYEYKYTRKVTTESTNNQSSYNDETSKPFTEHISRRDRTFGEPAFGSRLKSRSQSPFSSRTTLHDEDFNRELDSVFDRHDSIRARSTSPARFPSRGILKNARSDQNISLNGRSVSPLPFSSYRYTSPASRLSTSDNKTKVRITPSSTSDYSRSVISTNSTAVSQNAKYQIEIDGDINVLVNGKVNVVTNDNIRNTPPPLSDEQRSYANHLIDKYTRPSCSLRTINI